MVPFGPSCKISIDLDRNNPFYVSGDSITGDVVLELLHELSISSISVSLVCTEYAVLLVPSETGDMQSNFKNRHLQAKKCTRFKSEQQLYPLPILMKALGAKHKRKLSRGKHNFSFNFAINDLLAENIPGSFFLSENTGVFWELCCSISRPSFLASDLKSAVDISVFPIANIPSPRGMHLYIKNFKGHWFHNVTNDDVVLTVGVPKSGLQHDPQSLNLVVNLSISKKDSHILRLRRFKILIQPILRPMQKNAEFELVPGFSLVDVECNTTLRPGTTDLLSLIRRITLKIGTYDTHTALFKAEHTMFVFVWLDPGTESIWLEVPVRVLPPIMAEPNNFSSQEPLPFYEA